MDGPGGIVWGCKICGTAVPKKGDICPGCVRKVVSAEARILAAKDPEKICPKCKTPNRPKARFCHGCGEKLA